MRGHKTLRAARARVRVAVELTLTMKVTLVMFPPSDDQNVFHRIGPVMMIGLSGHMIESENRGVLQGPASKQQLDSMGMRLLHLPHVAGGPQATPQCQHDHHTASSPEMLGADKENLADQLNCLSLDGPVQPPNLPCSPGNYSSNSIPRQPIRDDSGGHARGSELPQSTSNSAGGSEQPQSTGTSAAAASFMHPAEQASSDASHSDQAATHGAALDHQPGPADSHEGVVEPDVSSAAPSVRPDQGSSQATPGSSRRILRPGDIPTSRTVQSSSSNLRRVSGSGYGQARSTQSSVQQRAPAPAETPPPASPSSRASQNATLPQTNPRLPRTPSNAPKLNSACSSQQSGPSANRNSLNPGGQGSRAGASSVSRPGLRRPANQAGAAPSTSSHETSTSAHVDAPGSPAASDHPQSAQAASRSRTSGVGSTNWQRANSAAIAPANASLRPTANGAARNPTAAAAGREDDGGDGQADGPSSRTAANPSRTPTASRIGLGGDGQAAGPSSRATANTSMRTPITSRTPSASRTGQGGGRLAAGPSSRTTPNAPTPASGNRHAAGSEAVAAPHRAPRNASGNAAGMTRAGRIAGATAASSRTPQKQSGGSGPGMSTGDEVKALTASNMYLHILKGCCHG